MVAWLAVAGQFASGLMEYQADKATAKAQKRIQAWRNTMTNLSNALNQNSITQNQIMSNEASRRQALDIQTDAMTSTSSLMVEAGAAEVAGRSVNQAVLAIKQSADVAEGIREQNLIDSWAAYDTQRVQSGFDAALQQDHSYIPKPNLGTYMLKAGIKSYNSLKG